MQGESSSLNYVSEFKELNDEWIGNRGGMKKEQIRKGLPKKEETKEECGSWRWRRRGNKRSKERRK